MSDPVRLRIALLSYRGKPHRGGQGIYVRRLSAALLNLGHDVEVISGPPYPELVDGVRLTKPVLASVRHPMQVDRRTELAGATGVRARLLVRRWYRFLPTGVRVARRLDPVVAVSEVARRDAIGEMGLDPAKVRVVTLGVEHDVFSPGRVAREENLIVAVASADVVSKGVLPLLEALAKVRTEVDARLVVVSRPGAAITESVTRLGLDGAVEFRSGLDDGQLADLVGSATIAVLPSLYEGSSLPAAEAMASATPLVVTDAGALPEVVGPHGVAAPHVPPGDPEAMAQAIRRLLADPELRDRLGAAGRAPVEAGLSWEAAARNAVAWYDEHRLALKGSRT